MDYYEFIISEFRSLSFAKDTYNKDFTISLEHTRRLRPYVPEDKVFVAESGITGDEDVRFLRDCGVDAFLIGRAFMESENPKALAQKWKELYQA